MDGGIVAKETMRILLVGGILVGLVVISMGIRGLGAVADQVYNGDNATKKEPSRGGALLLMLVLFGICALAYADLKARGIW